MAPRDLTPRPWRALDLQCTTCACTTCQSLQQLLQHRLMQQPLHLLPPPSSSSSSAPPAGRDRGCAFILARAACGGKAFVDCCRHGWLCGVLAAIASKSESRTREHGGGLLCRKCLPLLAGRHRKWSRPLSRMLCPSVHFSETLFCARYNTEPSLAHATASHQSLHSQWTAVTGDRPRVHDHLVGMHQATGIHVGETLVRNGETRARGDETRVRGGESRARGDETGAEIEALRDTEMTVAHRAGTAARITTAAPGETTHAEKATGGGTWRTPGNATSGRRRRSGAESRAQAATSPARPVGRSQARAVGPLEDPTSCRARQALLP